MNRIKSRPASAGPLRHPLCRLPSRAPFVGLALLAGALLPSTSAFATSATWLGSGGSWNSTNWSDVGGGTAAPGATSGVTNTDTATFNTSGSNSVTVDTYRNLQNIVFDTNVGSYTFGTGILYITNAGSIQLASTVSSSGQTETFNNPITLEGSSEVTFANNAATTDVLDFTGTVTAAAAEALYLGGTNTGANTISGGIGGSNKITIVKTGSGSWTLAGTNTQGGSSAYVVPNSGDLTLDFTNAASTSTNILSSTTRLVMGGGTLTLLANNSTGTDSQALGFLAANEGSSEITLTENGAGTLNLNLGATVISLNQGSAIDFTIGANTSVSYTGGTASTILRNNSSSLVGTVNGGADWAAVNAADNAIVPGASVTGFYTNSTATTIGSTNGQNVDIVNSSITLSAHTNSLASVRFNDISTPGDLGNVTISNGTNYVSTGGILVTPNFGGYTATISGNINSQANNTLLIAQYDTSSGANLNIGGSISANALGWEKVGGGLLTLAGTSNLINGPADLNGGTVNIAGDGSLGAVPGSATAGRLVFNGGTLQMGAANIAISSLRGIVINSNGGVIDTNGYNASYGGVMTGIATTNGGLTGAFAKAGAGTLSLTGNNLFQGAININDGTLSINSIANGGVLGATTTNTTNNSGSTTTVTVPTTVASTLTTGESVAGLPGLITDGTTITNIAIGTTTSTLTLSATAIASGSNVATYGTPNALGMSTNTSTNLTIGSATGATLQYTGATGSTDRLFQLNNTTGGLTDSIDASGTGALTFSNTGTITYGTANLAETFNLTGTNTGANTFAPLLQDNGSGKLSVTKTGIGSWTLTGANSYTGGTTVNAGILGVTGSLSSSGSLAVGAGGNFALGEAAGGASFKSQTVSTLSLTSTGSGSGNEPLLSFNLNGASYDSLTSTGALTLTGSTFELNLTGASTGTDNLLTWLASGSTPITVANVDLTLNGTDYGTSNSYLTIVSSGSNDILELSAVPEPSTWAMMLGGLAALLFWQRRKVRS